MICLILLPLALAFWVLVWFDTNAFGEYTELFRLGWTNRVLGAYLKTKAQGSPISFQQYLVQFKTDTFLGRLLTCPVCVSAWIAFFTSIVITPVMIIRFGPWVTLCYTAALPFLILFSYRLINKIK